MNNFSLGRAANLAPSGIASFAKCDICTDLNSLQAYFAVLGAPCDIAIQGRSGARLGPRGIRLASTRFSYKPGGSYDPERNRSFMDSARVKVLDCGDADYVPGDLEATFANISAAVKIIASKGAIPVVLGGDHSISYPVLTGLAAQGHFNIIHFDSHLDWTRSVGGQGQSNGSPMRLASALPQVKKILHLGVRGIGSSGPDDFEDARKNGDQIYSVKQVRKEGLMRILEGWAASGEAVFVTLDIDAMDYSIAAGTGSPMFGGFLYDEMVDMLEAVAGRYKVKAFDLVEVSPPYDDPGGTTCYLAARLISDFMGFISAPR